MFSGRDGFGGKDIGSVQHEDTLVHDLQCVSESVLSAYIGKARMLATIIRKMAVKTSPLNQPNRMFFSRSKNQLLLVKRIKKHPDIYLEDSTNQDSGLDISRI